MIRKPDTTKNTSTPTKPPRTPGRRTVVQHHREHGDQRARPRCRAGSRCRRGRRGHGEPSGVGPSAGGRRAVRPADGARGVAAGGATDAAGAPARRTALAQGAASACRSQRSRGCATGRGCVGELDPRVRTVRRRAGPFDPHRRLLRLQPRARRALPGRCHGPRHGPRRRRPRGRVRRWARRVDGGGRRRRPGGGRLGHRRDHRSTRGLGDRPPSLDHARGRRLDARTQGAHDRAGRRRGGAARWLRHARRGVRGAHVEPARHRGRAGGVPRRRRLLPRACSRSSTGRPSRGCCAPAIAPWRNGPARCTRPCASSATRRRRPPRSGSIATAPDL